MPGLGSWAAWLLVLPLLGWVPEGAERHVIKPALGSSASPSAFPLSILPPLSCPRGHHPSLLLESSIWKGDR